MFPLFRGGALESVNYSQYLLKWHVSDPSYSCRLYQTRRDSGVQEGRDLAGH